MNDEGHLDLSLSIQPGDNVQVVKFLADMLYVKTDYEKYIRFWDRTGMLYPKEVWDLGFEDAFYFSAFSESQVSMLIKFCEENIEFHIVTSFGDYFVNKVILGQKIYYLANGDSDPALSVFRRVLAPKITPEEFYASEGFSEYNELRRNGELPSYDEVYPKKVVH